MAKKQKIYDTSIVDSLNDNINLYNNYLSPNVDVDAYLHLMQNPTIDRAPDNYSTWNSAFATWNKNRNEVNKDSSLGDYILAEEELTSLINAQQYLQDKEELNELISQIDPIDGIDDETKEYVDSLINRIKSNENDYLRSFDDILLVNQASPSVFTGEVYLPLPNNKQDYFKEDPLKQMDILNKEIKIRQDALDKHLADAREYSENAAKWDKKINDYYRNKSNQPGMDFTDLDTYIYKVPGLMGSSAATLGANVLGVVGGALMAIPDPTGLTKLAGAAVLVGSNVYSRDNESSAEAYSAYKESVRKKAQNHGIEDKILNNAKRQMQQSQLYTQEQIDNDDFVYDQILTGKIDALNEKLKTFQQSALDGASSVYKDNMALSTWDVVSDILTVFPLGKLAKTAKAVAPSKLLKGLDRANDMRQQLSNRIDDVISYGLEGIDKLPKKRMRKRLADLGGRLVLTSALEGAEEGTQYMLSKDMQEGIYDADAGLFNRWLHNVGRGARSLYAALTPFDPVYSDDAEFIENFKGGALLGGIMTGSVGGASLIASSIDYGKNQYPVTQVMANMYADKLDATDRVKKNLAYSEYMRNDKWARVEGAFEDLKEAKIEGVDDQIIEDEHQRANFIRNVYTSPIMRKRASELGIDPRTEDYSLFVALYDHHEQLFKDASKSLNDATNQVTSMLNSSEVNDYIDDLDIVKTGKIDATTVRTAIFLKAYLELINKVIDRFDNYQDAQTKLQEKTGIRTSKSDIIEVKHLLEKNKNVHQRDYDLSESIQTLKAIDGFDESILSVPAIHQDLSDAIELVIGNELDKTRAEAERTIMRSNDKQLIQGKINRYKEVQDGETELVQRLNDMYSGKNEQDVVDNAVEVDIPAVDTLEPLQKDQQEKTISDSGEKTKELNKQELSESEVIVLGESKSRSGRSYKILAFLDDTVEDDFTTHIRYNIRSASKNDITTFNLDDLLKYVSEDYLEKVSYHNFENNKLETFKVSKVRKYVDKVNGITHYYLDGSAQFDIMDDTQEVTIEVSNLPEQFKPLFNETNEVEEKGKTETPVVEQKELQSVQGNESKQELENKDQRDAKQIEDSIKAVGEGLKESVKVLRKNTAIEFINKDGVKAAFKQAAENLAKDNKDVSVDSVVNYLMSDTEDARIKDLLSRVLEFDETKAKASEYITLDESTQETIAQQEQAQIKQQEQANKQKESETNQEQPQTLTDVLSGVLGSTYTDALQNQSELPSNLEASDSQAQVENESPLTYDKNVDTYSHNMGYWMTQSERDENGNFIRISKKYTNAEHLLNNELLGEITGKPDFYEQMTRTANFEVMDYVNPVTGKTEDSIYMVFDYNGKKYGTYVSTQRGLTNNRQFARLPYEQQQIILNNLNVFRNKIINLSKGIKNDKSKKVVPTHVRVTNGQLRNERNEDGTAKNRKLTESRFLEQKDPSKINYQNTTVAITTGPIGGNYTRIGDLIVTVKNSANMGMARIITKVRRGDGTYGNLSISLNTANFKNSPELVDFILDLLVNNANQTILKDGTVIPIRPQDLLQFIVNFGAHTATNPEDVRLSAEQRNKRLSKQFYQVDNTRYVIGANIYTVDDILGSRRDEIKKYIQDNFHWAIPEHNLNRNWFGGNSQSRVKAPGFEQMSAWFKNSGKDKIEIIPGFFFTKEDFGVGVENINGISTLGWYIREGILLTDVSDEMPNANIYVDDVTVVDMDAQQTMVEAVEKVAEPKVEDKEYDLPGEGGGRNKFKWSDIQEILDGKKRKTEDGANMTIERDAERIKVDTAAASQWLSDKLGISPKIVPNVIDTTEAGLDVVGRVTEDAIKISEEAPEGVQYHEAWHRVSLFLLSPKERKNLYRKYIKRGMTEKQAEEHLAEQYREFMNYADAKQDSLFKFDFDSKNVFRNMFDFVRLWVRVGKLGLAKVMYYTSIGKYKGLVPNKENVERFRQIYPKGVDMEVAGTKLSTITTEKQLDDIVKSLLYAFFQTDFSNQTIDYTQLANVQPNFENLKRLLRNSQATDVTKMNPVMDEIIEKFDDVIAPRLKTKLKRLGIRAFDVQQSDIASKEEGGQGSEIGQHTVEGMNISIKDNAPAEVKFFMMTIPVWEYDKTGKVVNRLHPTTGFPMFYESNKAWDKVLKDLSGCRTIQNIVDRVARLSEEDLFYKSLFGRLTTLVKGSIKEDRIGIHSEALLSKIETVITSDVNNYLTVKVDEDEIGMSRHKLLDNGVDVTAAKYPRIWSQALFNNSGLFKYSGDKIVANTNTKESLQTISKRIDNFIRIFTEFDGVISNGKITIDFHTAQALENLKADIINILGSLGILFDLESLNRLLGSGNYGAANADQFTKLKNFITSTANYGGLLSIKNTVDAMSKAIDKTNTVKQINVGSKTVDVTEIWVDNGFAKVLANIYAYTHATDRGLSTLGPDGNSYYKVSQNNFFKDRINELNTDAQARTDLESVVYNRHSVVLQAAKDGNRLEVETFINFKDSTSHDVGRDYFGITDREDYIAKMDMIFADRLISPTIADKKTYHVIKGIALPHEAVNFVDVGNGRYGVTYGEQTLDILLGYVNDEYERVKLTLRLIDDNNKDNPDWLPPSKRIKNYHTSNKYKGKDGKTHKIEGNGARFIYFNGLTIVENGKQKFINFNDPTKTAKENLKIAEDYFFGLPVEHQKRLLSGLISSRVKEEIETAKGLGLIEGNEVNNIWALRNKLLDDTVVAQRSQRYRGMSPTNAEGFAIWDMFADYVVGSIISVTEVEKLFSGDPAYYKVLYNEKGMIDNSVDKIKRLTALTATGTNNRLDFFNAEMPTEYTVTEFADHEIRSKQWDELEGLFIRGNIKETIQELEGEDAWNEVKDKSVQEIEKIYPDAVKIATQAAKSDVLGYKKEINVADAAVYITPKMFKNLMRMQGLWSPEIKRAFEILTDEKTADTWYSDAKLYAEANKVILNALKYMAFGTRYRNGLGIPYFNKMALFPLFKSIATGDLKLLYDRMTEPGNEIDMVLFNSAVKAGSESPQSFYRVAKDSELDLKDGQTVISARMQDAIESDEGTVVSDLSQLHVYKQSFKYLRQQLLTDPHIHEELMAGTQFVKVNLSNLRMNDLYGKEGDQKSGRDIFREIMDDINTLSDLGKAELEAELLNEAGEVDQRKLALMLLDDAMESDANDNIIAALRDAIRTGSFDEMPLSAMSDNRWLESRFISLINKKIIDINIAGGAFIQRSAFGMEATDSRVITPNMINDGRVLKLINEEGSMDAVVSINLFKHIIPDYKKKTFTEAKQWLLDHNIIGPNATANTIGYRIPTQSIASISALRFVDVFPEIMGDTIMLPEDFTKLTGSDFDIDKLFVARLQYDSNGNLITEGAEGIKNHLLQNYLRVLLTKENTSSLKLSIDVATDNVKAVLRDIEGSAAKEIVQPFYPHSPTYQESKKSEYTGGKAGIGPFALNNAHHILTQLTGLHMNENEFTTRLNISDVSRIFDNPTISKPKGGRILDWLSAMINAFVDIAKDPYIVRLNVNPWTYNMVSFLLRTGMGERTFYFMSQPILKEMAQEVLKTKGKFGIDRTKTPNQLETEAIEKVLMKYDPSGLNRKKYDYAASKPGTAARAFGELFDTFLSEGGETSMLRELIKNPDTENAMFAERQLLVYYAFKAIKPYADSLANLVKYSKIDTKKTGKSFAAQQTYLNGMAAMLEDENFLGDDVERFFNETFIERKTMNAIPFGTMLFKNFLLRNTDKFLAQKDAVLSLLGRKDNANEKLLSAVINSMESQTKAKFFNQYLKKNNLNLKDMFIGPNSIGQRLNNFKQRVLRNEFPDLGLDGNWYNDFLEYLLPNLNNEYGLNFVDVSEILSNDQTLDNNLINYWRELIQHPNERVSKLFKDLAVYAFFTTGDNTTMNGFFKYLPNSFRKEIGYNDFIAEEMKQYNNKQVETVVSREDIFLNNWINDALVKPVDMYITVGEAQYGLKSLNLTPEDLVPNLIVGERSNMKGIAIRPLNWASVAGYSEKFPVFPPFIKIKQGANTIENWHVYKLIGFKFRPKENNPKLKDFIPVYGLVEKKGYKRRGHTIYEYDLPTAFDFNRERVYNYSEIIRQQQYLLDGITDNEMLRDEWADIISNSGIHFISELPSYRHDVKIAYDSLYEEDADFDNNEDTAVALSEKEEPVVEESTKDVSNNPSKFTNHSGGAPGSDYFGWDIIGREYGVTNHKHYYSGVRDEYNAPYGNTEVTEQDYKEGSIKVAQAAKRNWGYQRPAMKDPRLIRNWSQVKYADAIFAIGTIAQPGEQILSGNRVALVPAVKGGTGYAVGMAIIEGKPVHIFDQTKNAWYTWDGENFVQEETPTLTKNFAGIGTREINEAGKKAIRDVYNKTFTQNANSSINELTDEQKQLEGEQIKKQCKGE